MHIEALQRHRINRVMNFARNCESEVLTLENLADVACLSRYHFSRIFTEHCRETPIEFVSRLRLEQSVSNLIYLPNASVTAIAFEAGFSSSQAFSNAFRRRFGISPRNFRINNSWYITDFPKNQYVLSPLMSKLLAPVRHFSQQREVVLRTMPATRLAYIRHRGAYYLPSKGKSDKFVKLIEWAKLRGLWQENTEVIAVCPDNPAVTPPQFCQHDFGVAVEDGVKEDDFISIQNLPEMTLATLRVSGSSQVARVAWRWFISEWLPQSGMTKANHDYFEIFDSKFAELGCLKILGGSQTEGTLCIPVAACNINSAKDNAHIPIPIAQNLAPYGMNRDSRS